jgi:transposase
MASEAQQDVPGETRRGGRPPKLGAEQVAHVRELALARPTATLDELRVAVADAVGVKLTTESLRKYLEEAGVVRVKPARQTGAEARAGELAHVEAGKGRYGYADRHRDPGDAVRYPAGLTDAEWALVADVFETQGPGRPPKYPRRALVDACCYVVRTGMAWRMLPKDMPPWTAVYATFRRWTSKGLFERMHDRLRAAWREREHRAVEPTASVIDSQSVKASAQGGPKGYDAGKKVKGRKRHLVTDTLGLLLAVCVQTADIQDRDGAHPVVDRAVEKYPGISKLYADSA